jgi:hypothetical protein
VGRCVAQDASKDAAQRTSHNGARFDCFIIASFYVDPKGLAESAQVGTDFSPTRADQPPRVPVAFQLQLESVFRVWQCVCKILSAVKWS